MQIKCCKCGKEYPAKFYTAEGVNVPIVECPYCGFQHAVEFTPLNQKTDSKKHEVKKLNLGGGPYYALLGGTRILSIDAVTDHSGVDDGNVINWTKTVEFIIAACIHSGGKDTESSTYKLQWQDDNDGGGYVDLASDSGSPELSFTIDDVSWNHGATVATGDQVCDIQDSYTRQAGERIKNQSLSDAIDLPDEYQSELWFGIDSTNADDGHVYSFQLYSVVEGAAVGICGATITMEAGAGPMSASSDITFSTASDIQGKGKIQAAPDITFTTAADIQALGLILATSDITFTTSATLTDAAAGGAMSGSSNITFTNAAIVKGRGRIQTAADITFTNAAIVKGRGRIQAAPDITFTNAAIIKGTGSFSGESNIAFSAFGSLLMDGAGAGLYMYYY